MNNEEAYIEGFCKAAGAAGVNPEELYKFAQDAKKSPFYDEGMYAGKDLAETLNGWRNDLSTLASGISKYKDGLMTGFKSNIRPVDWNKLESVSGYNKANDLLKNFRTRSINRISDKIKTLKSVMSKARLESQSLEDLVGRNNFRSTIISK